MAREPVAYLNGELLPAAQARLPLYDAGFVFGATVTEQVRTIRHQLYRLDDHLDRLSRSLRSTRLDPGLRTAQLAAIARDVADHNAALLHPDDDLGLIVFVTPGDYRPYAPPGAAARAGATVGVHTFPLPFERWAGKWESGQHLVTPSVRHVPPQCFDPAVKCRSRMHWHLADQEARLVDPEATALLLDLDGRVTETGSANVFLVERGALVTPTLRNALPGVSRAVVIGLAGRLGVPVAERDFSTHALLNAAEVFTTSTPYGLLPVTRVNGVPVAAGRAGPLTLGLLEAWGREVGLDLRRQILDGARRRQTSPDNVSHQGRTP